MERTRGGQPASAKTEPCPRWDQNLEMRRNTPKGKPVNSTNQGFGMYGTGREETGP
jgi:hypothetical protein